MKQCNNYINQNFTSFNFIAWGYTSLDSEAYRLAMNVKRTNGATWANILVWASIRDYHLNEAA